MEDSRIESPSASDLPHLRHRISVPDVPEDVEDEYYLNHLNDPNWDFHANSETLSISTDGVKRRRSTEPSVNVEVSTEFDTESHVSSFRMRHSKAEFSTEAIQVQWVFPPRCPCSISSFVLSYRDSPYPEVRAAVANTDDPDMLVNTFRV
jgi:hypothetical protein